MSSPETEIPAATRPGEGSPSLLGETSAVLRAHQDYLVGLVDIAAAEASKVGLSLALLACATGLLILTLAAVWIFACAAIGAAIVAAGASWLVALLAAMLANIALALCLWLFIVRMGKNLGFSHLRGALRPTPSVGAPRAETTTGDGEEVPRARPA